MPQSTTPKQRTSERITLALQGGGAFGAFQAGVLQALHEAGIRIDACCGSSIGAINAALYFGNEPARRIERLRAFWHGVSVPGSAWREEALHTLWPPTGGLHSRTLRRMLAEADQTYALHLGLPGFFVRRADIPWVIGTGNPGDASVFDTRPLSRTLSDLCDFELLNRSSVQVSVVAANAASGAAHYFSNHDGGLDAARIMASGALPPWFPAVEIDGAWYWDGSLATAAPMRHLVANAPAATRTTILRADLWSCDGPLADNLVDVVGIDYERSQCEAHFKDSQFGKTAIDEHWANGRRAAEAALSQIDTA